MKTSLKLEGVADLKQALDALGHEVAEKVGAAAVRASARELQKEAVETAPRGPGRPKAYTAKDGTVRRTDYGHLYQNIRVRRERARAAYTIRFVVTTGRAFWGYFLEVGTVRMRPHPWARPLFERMQLKLLDIMLQQLRIGTERAAKRAARKALRRPSRGLIGHNGGPDLED